MAASKWEYKTHLSGAPLSDGDLTDFGGQGWELVTMVPPKLSDLMRMGLGAEPAFPNYDNNSFVYIFKRTV